MLNNYPKKKSLYKHRKQYRYKKHDYASDGWYFVTICTGNREIFFGDVINGKMTLNEAGEIARGSWAEIPKHFPFVKLDEFIIMPNHIHGIIRIDNENFNKKYAPAGTRHRLVHPAKNAHHKKNIPNPPLTRLVPNPENNPNVNISPSGDTAVPTAKIAHNIKIIPNPSNSLLVPNPGNNPNVNISKVRGGIKCFNNLGDERGLNEAVPRSYGRGDTNGKNKKYTGEYPRMSKISPEPKSLSVIIGSYKSIVTKTINIENPDLEFSWQNRFHDRIVRNDDALDKIRNYIVNNPEEWKRDRNNMNLDGIFI